MWDNTYYCENMREEIYGYCGDDLTEEELFADPKYDDCLIGMTTICHSMSPAYDFNDLIKFIQHEYELTESGAIEFFNNNILVNSKHCSFVKFDNESTEAKSEYNQDMLFMDGLEAALVGVRIALGCEIISVYDENKCISTLIDEGMEEEEAIEHFDYNVRGAYVGEHTPAILTLV